jgi:hypothetical protein
VLNLEVAMLDGAKLGSWKNWLVRLMHKPHLRMDAASDPDPPTKPWLGIYSPGPAICPAMNRAAEHQPVGFQSIEELGEPSSDSSTGLLDIFTAGNGPLTYLLFPFSKYKTSFE